MTGSRDLDPWNLGTPRVREHRTRVGKPTGAGTWSPGPAVPESRGALPEPGWRNPQDVPLGSRTSRVDLFPWALVVVFPTNEFLPSSPPGPIRSLRAALPHPRAPPGSHKDRGAGEEKRAPLFVLPWLTSWLPSHLVIPSSTVSASLEFFSLLDFTPDPRPRFGTKIESGIRRREG